MRLLLDTNTILWLISANKNLGSRSLALINEAEEIYVSSLSIVEIEMKIMLNKIKLPANYYQAIIDSGSSLLPFDTDSAVIIKNFPKLSRHDPFDRMILVQASSGNLTLLTADKTLLGLGLPYILDAKK